MSKVANNLSMSFARETLTHDKSIIDGVISDYINNEFPTLSNGFTDFSKIALSSFSQILGNGGKRLRASLLINSYKNFGGTDIEAAHRAALAIEMVHAYLLVVDDFSDVSHLRRGSESAHALIEKFAEQNNLAGDKTHFGYSIAVTAGISGMHVAANIVLDLKVDEKTKLKLLHEINSCIVTTAHGQFVDIYNEVVDPSQVSQESILNVMKWKTSQYTFHNPIQIGALLAGASDDLVKELYEYSINAGLGFQIQDDIIGMFGKEEDTGKPTIDDLREGKVTFLMAKALELSEPSDKEIILKLLGNQDVTKQDHEAVKEIITSCGALDATVNSAKEYSQNAITSLDGLDITDGFKTYLAGIAELIVSRDR